MGEQTAFHDLPEWAFPARFEFFRRDNGERVHVIDLPGPGVVKIPALAREHNVGIDVKVTWGDGRTKWIAGPKDEPRPGAEEPGSDSAPGGE